MAELTAREACDRCPARAAFLALLPAGGRAPVLRPPPPGPSRAPALGRRAGVAAPRAGRAPAGRRRRVGAQLGRRPRATRNRLRAHLAERAARITRRCRPSRPAASDLQTGQGRARRRSAEGSRRRRRRPLGGDGRSWSPCMWREIAAARGASGSRSALPVECSGVTSGSSARWMHRECSVWSKLLWSWPTPWVGSSTSAKCFTA